MSFNLRRTLFESKRNYRALIYLSSCIFNYVTPPLVAASDLEFTTIDFGRTNNTNVIVSADGSTLAGNDVAGIAGIWSGSNYSIRTPVNTDVIVGLSANGLIATGGIMGNGQVFSGPAWSVVTTLDRGTASTAATRGISADGKVVGGMTITGSATRGTVWSGANWSNRTDLGTLKNDNSGNSSAAALSGDGSTIVGQSNTDFGQNLALGIVWSGPNWTTKTSLATLRTDGSGSSQASAVSGDGKVVGGLASSDNSIGSAVIWSGSNWSTKTDLGTLRSDNSGVSEVRALSINGSVVAGTSSSDNARNRATLWSGPGWTIKTDLGTLRSDNAGRSATSSMTSDGQVVVGTAVADDNTNHIALWRVVYSGTTPTVIAVDATNSGRTISELGVDTFSVLELQRQNLLNLQHGCIARGANDGCYSISGNYLTNADTADATAGFNIGYGLTDHLSVGLTIDRFINNSLPDSFKRNNKFIGTGIYLDWHAPFNGGSWYLRPSVSFNNYDVDVTRNQIGKTEAGKGNSKIEGWSTSLEGGQNFTFRNDNTFGWYIGARHTDVSRSGYTESNAYFPVNYSDTDYRDTAIYMGADVGISIAKNTRWVSIIELEQSVDTQDPTYNAQADYIGKFSNEADIAKTRGYVATGVEYHFSKDLAISIMPRITATALNENFWGTSINLTGRF